MKPRAISENAKAAKKQQMLQAALDEFYEKGFTAARMDDIAQRCQLSKGTLYLYFNSKEALFSALIETIAKPNQAHIITLLEQSHSAASALVTLTDFMPSIIAQGQLPKLMKILIGDSKSFPDIITNYKQQVIEKALNALTGLFERSNQAGETDIKNPDLMARLVVAPVIFSAVWKAVFTDGNDLGFDLQELFKLHQKLLLNNINLKLETP